MKLAFRDVESLDYRGHAPPRPVFREPSASFFVQRTEQSPMAKVELIGYEYRATRRRSRLYYATLLQIREVGWRPTKEINMGYPKGRPRIEMDYTSKTKSGQMIREARQKMMLVQAQAAKLIGVSGSSLAFVERGVNIIRDNAIPKYAKVLGLDRAALKEAVQEDRAELRPSARGRPSKRGYKGAPGEINRRWVIDYLVDDMDFDEDTVIEMVTEEKTYTMNDVQEFIEKLMGY